VFRGEPAGERVTFFPREEVRFERLSGATLGTIHNLIEETDDGALTLRFTFSLEREGIAPGSDEEQAYAREMEGAYLGAVDATLAAIRRFTVAESVGSPVEVAASPEVVGYLERLLETLETRDLDSFATHLAPNTRARLGNAAPATGQADIIEAVTEFLSTTGGPRHEIVDAWHIDDLIGAEVAMSTRRGSQPVVVPCVHLLRMDGDLIADHRVVADVTPLSG
jgi:hypothetical protein